MTCICGQCKAEFEDITLDDIAVILHQLGHKLDSKQTDRSVSK